MEAHGTLEGSDDRLAYLRARLGSLLAFAPLGLWTVNHLWDNLAAWQSGEAWQREVTGHSPASLAVTMVVVLGPLAFHTVWGLQRLRASKPNLQRYGFFANLKYLLQRLSAVGVLAFLAAHVWMAFVYPRFVQGRPEAFQHIAHEMHDHALTLAVYLLGTLGVSYHLANGLATLSLGFGVVSSRKGLGKIDKLSVGLFVVLLAMAWGAVFGLWRAGGAHP